MKCFVVTVFFISMFFAFWGILVYEYKYEAVTITSYACIKGWPETVKALSYGVVSGWIIFALTVCLPHKAEKRNRQISILSKLVSLNEELSYFIRSANIQDDNIEIVEYSGDSKMTLISAASFVFILYKIPWDSTFPNETHSYFDQAIIILKKIYYTIHNINLEHIAFLPEKQLECFAAIDTAFLKENWIMPTSEMGIPKIDVVKSLLVETAYALQKSINIPTNLNQKVMKEYQDRL